MSRNLPPHPNLQHLKKQAKDLLRELKQRNPALKLADAQHTLAREYGFASWPKLKAYVESVPRLVTPTEAYDAARLDSPSDTIAHIDSRSSVFPEQTNPFVGRWIANLSKSRRHPSNQFQSAMLQIAVDVDKVTIIDVVVDESGHTNSGKNTILVDENEHLSENNNGYTLVTRWRGPRVIETVAKKDGQVVGWGTYEVSDDGKTLTILGDEQMIVLDRD